MPELLSHMTIAPPSLQIETPSVPLIITQEIFHRLPADQLEWMAQRVAELTKPADEILTSDEAAAFLRCSKAQLSKLVNGGGLPAIKLDAYNRFLKSDLIAYAERHRQIDEVAA